MALPVDDSQLALKVYLKKVELRETSVHAIDSNKTGYYAFIKGSLSNESLARVELSEDWDKIDASKDPLGLWRLIKGTHLGAGTAQKELLLHDLRQEFYALAQGPQESVQAFRDRFEEIHQRLRALDEAEKPQKEMAMDAIKRLDRRRFAQLQFDLDNSIYSGRSRYPKTVAAAFELASTQCELQGRELGSFRRKHYLGSAPAAGCCGNWSRTRSDEAIRYSVLIRSDYNNAMSKC